MTLEAALAFRRWKVIFRTLKVFIPGGFEPMMPRIAASFEESRG